MKLPLHIHIGIVFCLAFVGWVCTMLIETFLGAVVLWVVWCAPIVLMTWWKMWKMWKGEVSFR